MSDMDSEDQLTPGDTLGEGAGSDVEDELDRGYSPPERWSPGQGFGNTPYEEATGESFEQRLAQEEPDDTGEASDEAAGAADEGDGGGAEAPAGRDEQWESEIDDGEVGDVRAGRLVDLDQGLGEDTEKDLVGDDVGIDGAAASAEEAAMHVIPDDD